MNRLSYFLYPLRRRIRSPIVSKNEIRYGDYENGKGRSTIYGSDWIDVIQDSKGKVVQVWFRFLPLKFQAHKEKGRSLHIGIPLKAIVVALKELEP